MKRGVMLILFLLVIFSLTIASCNGRGVIANCNDGIDNDGDGYIDGDDTGCTGNNREGPFDSGGFGCCEVVNQTGPHCLENSGASNCYDNPNYEYFASQTCAEAGCVPGCTDSDGGFNVYVEGVCIQTIGTTPFYQTDVCFGAAGDRVLEYYCATGTNVSCTATIVTCPSGFSCQAGACVDINTTITTTTATTTTLHHPCTDTDGGISYVIKGIVSGFDAFGSYNHTDSCSNSTFLTEWYCTAPSGGTAAQIPFQCNSTCFNGACV